MDTKIIDGKALALKREQELKEKIKGLKIKPKIVAIIVGNDPASLLYTQMKQKKAQGLNINFEYIHLPQTEEFNNVVATIIKLNNDTSVTGVMVQLPLPKEFLKGELTDELLKTIDPKKDVDGLTGKGKFLPAAVKAVMVILEEENIDVIGKKVVVLGTSKLIGMPIIKELEKMRALVTSVNSKTTNIIEVTQKADILISATGVAGILKGEMVKMGVVVIDVGTLIIEDELAEAPKQVVGDVDFESVYPKASKITPVPGGVGPLTVISLMENAVESLR